MLRNAQYSYLITNYLSGVSSVIVENSGNFSANDYLLFSNLGSETSEMVQLSTITSATHTLNLATATKFAHAESTKISVIPYNQVKYYQTASTTFDSNENYLNTVDVNPTSFFTIYEDTTNSTGYGWYVFYNSTTGKASRNSNAMPYAGFEESSTIKIFNSFYSLLNNNELKLITKDDAFRWLNEVYSIAKNKLNLVNEGFTTPTEWSFSVSSTTREVSLPSDFSDLISITDSEGNDLGKISLREKRYWDNNADATNIKYYLRGSYIGVSPTPSSDTTYYAYYKAKSSIISSYLTDIVLPENNYFFLVDGMLERASIKIPRLDRNYHGAKFKEGLLNMQLTGFKQDNSRDSWSIDSYANV